MNRKNAIIMAVAVLLVAVAIVSNAAKDSRPTETAARVGYLAPNIALKTLDGASYEFDHRNLDRPVLINFWASWCGPCESEAPALVDLHKKYEDRIEFIAVNITTWEHRGTDKITEFVEEFNLEMPVLLDEDGTALRDYHIIGIPVTVLVDRHGVISHIFPGEFDPKELDRRLARLL